MNLMGITPTPEMGIVAALAGIAALASVGVVVFENAVRSALCLVINFFTLAFLYFTLNAEMIGITQVVVYTGAIMVLFLFVIMLLNLGKPQLLFERRDVKVIGGLAMGAVFFGLIGSIVLLPLTKITQVVTPDEYGGPRPIGMALFTDFCWPFEVASFLLLVGIVGAILLAKRKI